VSVSPHHVSAARAVRLREAAALGPGGGEDHLRWLVRRVADNDRAAFAELFYRVSGAMSNGLHRQIPDLDRVAGVVAGTFVEVWWLAGGHVDPGTDVMAWLHQIVRRRLADSRPAERPVESVTVASAALTAFWAHRAEVELAGLLERHPTP
jgi:DNA-directed RNA polymerase specialized sigma24 family protein